VRRPRYRLVGGGNSAGHAAVSSPHCAPVHLGFPLLGPRCLHVRYHLSIGSMQPTPQYRLAESGPPSSGLSGTADGTRESIDMTAPRRAAQPRARTHMFLFIGADPNTRARSAVSHPGHKGLRHHRSDRIAVATRSPGVFAIGDVAARIGERVAAGVARCRAVVSESPRLPSPRHPLATLNA